MRLEQLESREVPANLIPGWTGGEQEIQGRFVAGPTEQTAVVALDGGSCRLVVVDQLGNVLLNTIAFDPSFRGGGHITAIGSVGPQSQDSLLVTPGAGGGPNVVQFDFDSSLGKMVETASFYAPYDTTYRGGLQVSSGNLPGFGEVALFLPGDEAIPTIEVGVSLQTHEQVFAVDVTGPGLAAFEPTGGTVGAGGGVVGLVVQYGPVVDYYVPTKVWSVGGQDITSVFVD